MTLDHESPEHESLDHESLDHGPLDDELLRALRTARPVMAAEADPAGPEARALLDGVLAPRPRSRRRLIGVSAGIAAAAAVAVGVALAAAPPKPGAGPPAPASPRTDLRTAVLAAFDSTAGTILHTHATWATEGEATWTSDSWTYPALAKPGARREWRQLIHGDGGSHQDVAFVYTEPAASGDGSAAAPSKAMGKPLTMGRLIDVEYGSRTWSDGRHTGSTVGDDQGPAELRRQVASGHFTVRPQATVAGRRAIELDWSPDALSTSRLWVDATTYQPVRSVFDSRTSEHGKSVRSQVVTTYESLPATAANRALLTPPIPAGFKHTDGPPAHPHG